MKFGGKEASKVQFCKYIDPRTEILELDMNLPPRTTKQLSFEGAMLQGTPIVELTGGPFPVADVKRLVSLSDRGLFLASADWHIGGLHTGYMLGYPNYSNDDPWLFSRGMRSGPNARYLSLKMVYVQTQKPDWARPSDYVVYGSKGEKLKLEEKTGGIWPLYGAKATIRLGGAPVTLGGEVIMPSSQPYFGFQVAPVIAEDKHIREGALVIALDPDGPARRAGLRIGDVILRKGTKRIREAADITAGEMVFESVKFTVSRAGRTLDLPIAPIPDPLWGMEDEGSKRAMAALGKACKQYPNSSVYQTFLYSLKPVPAGFVPARFGFKISLGGRTIREVRFKIEDIPIPPEFWKQMDKQRPYPLRWKRNG